MKQNYACKTAGKATAIQKAQGSALPTKRPPSRRRLPWTLYIESRLRHFRLVGR